MYMSILCSLLLLEEYSLITGYGALVQATAEGCINPRPEPETLQGKTKRKQLLLLLPLVSREWKNGSNSSYNCTPFLHSLLTKGKYLLMPSSA